MNWELFDEEFLILKKKYDMNNDDAIERGWRTIITGYQMKLINTGDIENVANNVDHYMSQLINQLKFNHVESLFNRYKADRGLI